MPRNGREGVLFSFTMSALMIYIMAALNHGVRTGEFGAPAWTYAFFNFPLAFVVGMVCDLGLCTPTSRLIMRKVCLETDRPVWKGLVVKFCMVVLMTVCMTIYGVIAAIGLTPAAATAFFVTFPYNFTLALPIQMVVIAPLAGRFVHFVGDRAGWSKPHTIEDEVLSVLDIDSLIKRDVYAVGAHETVGDAVATIVNKQISGLPVVREDGSVCGFISESDLLRHFAHNNAPIGDVTALLTGWATGEYPTEHFDEVMRQNVMSLATRDVVTFDRSDDVTELCSIFGLGQLKKIPVVDDRKLVGVINRSTLTRRAMEAYLQPIAA